MDAARRRYVQLGVALAVLAAAVWFGLLPSLTTNTPLGPAQPAAARGATRASDRQGRPVEVRLEALSRAAAIAGDSAAVAQRNPFRMGPATPRPSFGQGNAQATPRSAPPVVSSVPAPPQPPPVPPIPYRFIGVLSGAPGQGRIAVLTDGKNVVHGGVSQEIEGRYRIVQIGEESLQIEHLDGQGRQTLRLLGQ